MPKVQVSSSEPRDVGQLERTYLLTLKLGGFLILAAISLVVDFQMNTDGASPTTTGRKSIILQYSIEMAIVVLGICLLSVVVNSINYMITIKNYANHEIQTHNFNMFSVGSMTCVLLMFMAINIVFLYHGFLS